jgi:hypothetical protein
MEAKFITALQNLDCRKPVTSSTILGWRTRIESLEKNINYFKKQQQVFKCFANASRAVAQQISDDSTVWCNRLSSIESDLAKVDERISQLRLEAPLLDTGIGYSPMEIYEILSDGSKC